MCGIFGIFIGATARHNPVQAGKLMRELIPELFLLSESRGNEAAGLAVRHRKHLYVHKQTLSARRMLQSREYGDFLAELLDGGPLDAGFVLIGHSRLVTNGSPLNPLNNQPCASEKSALIHNGIIVNDQRLWEEFPDLPRQGEVDTEVLLRLIEYFRGENLDPATALAKTFGLAKGSASLAWIESKTEDLLLASNTGSLYYCHGPDIGVFASERYFLERVADSNVAERDLDPVSIRQIKPGTGLAIHPTELAGREFKLEPYPNPQTVRIHPSLAYPRRRMAPPRGPGGGPTVTETLPNLRRCTRCILPETMPFIDFDADGVCRYCREYQRAGCLGAPTLEKILAPHRAKRGEQDCILAFSGGRDSSFALHYVKKELGMNPVAFSYDWGMVTDLGRRNQARMCGQLGVEQILVSADIRGKRENIRRNIEAWLRRPHLGMIPLFTAGDKQFFYHANRLRRKTGIKLVVFAESPLEKTHFKTGFLGVREGGQRLYDMPALQKLKLNLAYAREFLRNPAYLNRSLLDSAFAFASAYLLRHNYLFLFGYIPWKEEEIDRTLLDLYDWETSPDSVSTWRIGDGTAAFYNYIFLTVAGFTEFDTLRSNQIREGQIGRSEALRRVEVENIPRMDSMREYARLIGFDLDEAMRIIGKIPKRYAAYGQGVSV